MSDTVTCKCVLSKNDPARGADSLFLVCPPDFRPRILPCRPVGTPQRGERPEWQYEERESGRLRVCPSLLATDTGFHTDYNWVCDYEICPEGIEQYQHFYAINPKIEPAT